MDNTFKKLYFEGVMLLHVGFILAGINHDRLLFLMLLDLCSVFLLNKQERKKLRRVIFGIIAFSAVSRLAFTWCIRLLALVCASSFIILATLNFITKPDLLTTAILLIAALYYFCWLNWMLDATPPIDKRIINCFR